MNNDRIETAVMIGAGNLGFNLGLALNKKGIKIKQVISRSTASAKKLALLVDADFSANLSEIKADTDIIIIAVPDREINAVIQQINFRQNLVVHTAGSVPMQIFSGRASNYGVFYPLMTFTRNKPVDFTAIPVLIEANNSENTLYLEKLARLLSHNVQNINSEQRMYVHLAAVMACNFPNHLYTLAGHILNQHGIEFDILKPLIREATDKIFHILPQEAQTGPAVRNDTETMNKHLKLLEDNPLIAAIYNDISKSIITFAGKKVK